MANFDYNAFRFGSSRFASSEKATDAGLHHAETGLYLGFDDQHFICRSSQQAPVLLLGGARSGKGNHIIPWLIDGAIHDHVISMDWKGQNGAISQLQHDPNVRVINWAPRGSNFPTHKINPVSYLVAESPTLVADTKLFTQSWIPLSGSKDGEFFQLSAQRWLEAVVVFYVERCGFMDLPGLTDIMAVFGSNTDKWKEFEFLMEEESDYPFVRAIAQEILHLRNAENPNAGGFAGIKAELAKSFACMSDPQIRDVITPPYDFDFSELVLESAPRTQVNIMEMMEFAQTSAPIVKALYTSALIYKRRTFGARGQLWLLDEIGNIGKWPLAVELGTFGPGYGIRPVYVVQSTTQLDNLAPKAAQIIPNSCGTQTYKGVRDFSEAKRISDMLGTMTLQATDARKDDAAKDEMVRQAYLMATGQGDTIANAIEYAAQEDKLDLLTPMRRNLLTPAEIINLSENDCLLFMPGKLDAPMILSVPAYWTRKDLAGRYLGDPFHDRPGTVSISDGEGGAVTAEIISEDPPASRADLPQHSNGVWSYVAGYKPQDKR